MNKTVFLIPALLLGACAMLAVNKGNQDDMRSHIEAIERSVTIPEGGHKIERYLRYYANDEVGEKSIVIGLYLANRDEVGIKIVDKEDLPNVLDGGCDVIRLRYDRVSMKVIEVNCAGKG
jgi:hypothetical protein